MNPAYAHFNLHLAKGPDKDTLTATVNDYRGTALCSNTSHYRIDSYILSRLEASVGKDMPENARLIKEFGSGLFKAIFSNEILGHYKAFLKENKTIRLKLFFRQDEPELMRIPYEFMFDGDHFLSAHPGITLSRALEGIPIIEKGNIKGKIKMLAVISSPIDLKDNERLQVEQEQMLILQAVDRAYAANAIEVEFLDEASLKAIQARLDEEEYHIFHYTGHGVFSESHDKGYLLLEDDSGRSRHVDNETIAELLSGYPSLRLVVLSGCQTAKTSGRRAQSDLSTPLLLKKIPAVISMQYSVSDQSAMELAKKLYIEISNGASIDLAVARARKELLLEQGAGMVDFATPVLFSDYPECLCREEATPVKDGFRFQKPITIKTNIVLGLEQLGNQFIGRRRDIRRVKEDFLTRGMRAVVLHGIGGIGKTVTATKIAEKLEKQFSGIYAFNCREGLTIEGILTRLDLYLKSNGENALEAVCAAPIPMEQKINYLAQVLSQVRLLLIFDNFETLLVDDEENSEIADPELKKGLKSLVNQCSNWTSFLFTSRYTFNLMDGRLTNVIDEINLGEMPRPEAIMVMNRFPVLAKEDFGTKIAVYEKIGGHPYTINIFGRHANNTSVQDVLKDLNGINKEMVEFTLLEKSYSKLTDKAKDLVIRSSVFRKAIPLTGLAWMASDDEQQTEVTKRIDELIHWGLIVKTEDEGEAFYQVHTLVKDFVKTKVSADGWKRWMIKAAEFYEALVETTGGIWDLLDARELYFEAREYDKAGAIVSAVVETLHRWGFIDFVRRLNEQTVDTASDLVKAIALHHLGIIHQDQGDYDKAIEKYNQSLEIVKELGNKGGIASTLHELGMIHAAQGDYDKAIEKYNQSLEIEKELGNKGGIASTLHELGIIHYIQGDYDKAIGKYNQSLEIKKALGDKSGIASTFHQLGMIHEAQRDYDKAIETYTQSLEITKEMGNKGGVANTLHQLGNIHYRQGDYDKAIEKYNQSLEIKKALGDKSGIAGTHGQFGHIHMARKEYKEAMKNFLICFLIFQQLQSPNRDLAAKHISILKEEIGEDAFKKLYEEVMGELGVNDDYQ